MPLSNWCPERIHSVRPALLQDVQQYIQDKIHNHTNFHTNVLTDTHL